jgi:hypothetical protein
MVITITACHDAKSWHTLLITVTSLVLSMATAEHEHDPFWHKVLAAKRTHSSVKLLGTVRFCSNKAQSSQFHAGMCMFGSQILVPTVCKYIKSGHIFWR